MQARGAGVGAGTSARGGPAHGSALALEPLPSDREPEPASGRPPPSLSLRSCAGLLCCCCSCSARVSLAALLCVTGSPQATSPCPVAPRPRPSLFCPRSTSSLALFPFLVLAPLSLLCLSFLPFSIICGFVLGLLHLLSAPFSSSSLRLFFSLLLCCCRSLGSWTSPQPPPPPPRVSSFYRSYSWILDWTGPRSRFLCFDLLLRCSCIAISRRAARFLPDSSVFARRHDLCFSRRLFFLALSLGHALTLCAAAGEFINHGAEADGMPPQHLTWPLPLREELCMAL